MKEIKFLDPSIKRKKDLTNKNFQLIKGTNIPLPSEVEISESECATENVLSALEVIQIIWMSMNL